MDLKFCELDLSKATKAEIKSEIERLDKLRNFYENLNQGIKIFLNSCYGAVGNSYFACYNTDVAEAVTLQGQNLIKFSIKILNLYLTDVFPYDEELHKKLNIKLKPSFKGVKSSPVIYSDTDSCYVCFENTLQYFDTSYYGEDLTKLILNIVKYDLSQFLNDKFIEYAKHFNTDNLQDFELEQISFTGLFLDAKKKYILDVAWKEGGAEGVFYKKGSEYKYTGVEIIRSSTPVFVRERLKEFTKYLVDNSKSVTMQDILQRLRKMRSEFLLEDIQNISESKSISDYEKYVLNDRGDTLQLNKGCPIHVRAAAIHNFLINRNPKLKAKYRLIRSGDKIKYFYCISAKKENNVFGFLPGEFPKELNITPDYKFQFTKTVIEVVNRFVYVILKKEVPNNLVVMKSLF